MNTLQVEWTASSKDGRSWGVTTLLADAEIIEDRRTGLVNVEWSYSPKIRKRLLDPDIYARLSLQFQSQLRSSASLALYEICSRYVNSPAGVTLREAWRWWRPRLNGIPDGQPETQGEYKYFKRDILKLAMAEVNAVTDIQVELIEYKQGKIVDEIQFRVRKKPQTGLPLSDPNLFDTRLISRMVAIGVAKREAETFYGETEEATLRGTLDWVEARIKRPPKVENPAALFKDALKKGYGKSALPKPNSEADVAKSPKKNMEAILANYHAAQLQRAQEMFGEMNPDQQEQNLSEFEETVLPTQSAHANREFKKRGLDSPMVSAAFYRWLANRTWGEPTSDDILRFVLEGPNI